MKLTNSFQPVFSKTYNISMCRFFMGYVMCVVITAPSLCLLSVTETLLKKPKDFTVMTLIYGSFYFLLFSSNQVAFNYKAKKFTRRTGNFICTNFIAVTKQNGRYTYFSKVKVDNREVFYVQCRYLPR